MHVYVYMYKMEFRSRQDIQCEQLTGHSMLTLHRTPG